MASATFDLTLLETLIGIDEGDPSSGRPTPKILFVKIRNRESTVDGSILKRLIVGYN